MGIKDYRRKLKQDVATAKQRRAAPQWGAVLEGAGVVDILGRARGGPADANALRSMVSGGKASPKLRAAALGKSVSGTPVETAHEVPLARLADRSEDAAVRVAAFGLLKQLSISSPAWAEWRPRYLDALRSTLDVPELRLQAFSTLMQQGDRKAQEILLDGLREPGAALVPAADALNFLSYDPHTDVQGLARTIVDAADDDRAVRAALRHLASDTESVERLKGVISDNARPTGTRRAAATALNTLDQKALVAVSRRPKGAAAVATPGSDVIEEHIAGLLRPRGKK